MFTGVVRRLCLRDHCEFRRLQISAPQNVHAVPQRIVARELMVADPGKKRLRKGTMQPGSIKHEIVQDVVHWFVELGVVQLPEKLS